MLIIAMIILYYLLKFRIKLYLFIIGLIVEALGFIVFMSVVIGSIARI